MDLKNVLQCLVGPREVFENLSVVGGGGGMDNVVKVKVLDDIRTAL